MQSQMNLRNVAGGHKAALKNPNVSDEAKEHSQQVLEEMESRGELPEQNRSYDEKNIGNVIGGHKAATKNPNVSEEAKENSKQFLEDIAAED